MNRFAMENEVTKVYLGHYKGKVSSKVKDRANDPYFVKKAEASKRTLRSVGLPPELLKIQAERMKN